MKQKIFLLLLIFSASFSANAKEQPVFGQLHKFSPLAQIIVNNLGLEDKNANGVIDKGAEEGYENFVTKYGTNDNFEENEKIIDCGFYANGVIIHAGNEKLEENEIVNFYYMYIRFTPVFEKETAAIDTAIKSYIYKNDIPLVWLDDEQGSVKKTVDSILGEGWNEQELTEDDAVILYRRVLNRMGIKGKKGDPLKNNGYYTLLEFVEKKAGYCVEAAQFGFWFFSELKINSLPAYGELTSSVTHQLIKLRSGRIVDYFEAAKGYNMKQNDWYLENPIISISIYYNIKANILNSQTLYEQALLYDKYCISKIGILTKIYYQKQNNSDVNIAIYLGEHFMNNNDIDKIFNGKCKTISTFKQNLRSFFILMLASYDFINDTSNCNNFAALLRKYYPNDAEAKKYLKDFGY